jgi:hypothetical protein
MLVQFSEIPMANVLPRKLLKPKKTTFDAQLFLDSVGASRRVEEFRTKQAIFSQGEPADSVIYVQKGSVKLTVSAQHWDKHVRSLKRRVYCHKSSVTVYFDSWPHRAKLQFRFALFSQMTSRLFFEWFGRF